MKACCNSLLLAQAWAQPWEPTINTRMAVSAKSRTKDEAQVQALHWTAARWLQLTAVGARVGTFKQTAKSWVSTKSIVNQAHAARQAE
jgi:hypothetical protein